MHKRTIFSLIVFISLLLPSAASAFPGIANFWYNAYGVRMVTFTNTSAYPMQCKAQNVVGEWVVTPVIPVGMNYSMRIGNYAGSWNCYN